MAVTAPEWDSVFSFANPDLRLTEHERPVWPIEIKGPSAGKLLAMDTK
jgi:hypothetical protein